MASFRHIGGDCFYRTLRLTEADLDHFADLYRQEVRAAFHAGDDPAYEIAVALLKEVIDAQNEQARWLRCTSIKRAA
jgi:hypothetical protein